MKIHMKGFLHAIADLVITVSLFMYFKIDCFS